MDNRIGDDATGPSHDGVNVVMVCALLVIVPVAAIVFVVRNENNETLDVEKASTVVGSMRIPTHGPIIITMNVNFMHGPRSILVSYFTWFRPRRM